MFVTHHMFAVKPVLKLFLFFVTCYVWFIMAVSCGRTVSRPVQAGLIKRIGFTSLDYDTSRMFLYNRMNEAYILAMNRALARYDFQEVIHVPVHFSAYTYNPSEIRRLIAEKDLDALVISRTAHVTTYSDHLYTKRSANLQMDFHMKCMGKDVLIAGEHFSSAFVNDFGKQPAILESLAEKSLARIFKNYRKQRL